MRNDFSLIDVAEVNPQGMHFDRAKLSWGDCWLSLENKNNKLYQQDVYAALLKAMPGWRGNRCTTMLKPIIYQSRISHLPVDR